MGGGNPAHGKSIIASSPWGPAHPHCISATPHDSPRPPRHPSPPTIPPSYPTPEPNLVEA